MFHAPQTSLELRERPRETGREIEFEMSVDANMNNDNIQSQRQYV